MLMNCYQEIGMRNYIQSDCHAIKIACKTCIIYINFQLKLVYNFRRKCKELLLHQNLEWTLYQHCAIIWYLK
jgi:hypothetical protein